MERLIPTRNHRVVCTQLAGGEAVLLHLDSGAYHELNPIGVAIWNLVDGRRDGAQIAVELRAEVEDPPADLEDIVTGFLDDLRQRELLG